MRVVTVRGNIIPRWLSFLPGFHERSIWDELGSYVFLLRKLAIRVSMSWKYLQHSSYPLKIMTLLTTPNQKQGSTYRRYFAGILMASWSPQMKHLRNRWPSRGYCTVRRIPAICLAPWSRGTTVMRNLPRQEWRRSQYSTLLGMAFKGGFIF